MGREGFSIIVTRNGRVLLLLLLLLYWAVSLRHLAIVPRVYEDEPWQASTGWKLATEGVFGSDLFAGYYQMEERYYGYLPIHPLLLAGLFRLAGLGLFQARFEPVVMGLLILTLTFALGRRLFDEKIGIGAVIFLLFVRLHGLTPSQVSGILFLDISRIARYDMVAAMFGLTAVHLYLWARQRGPLWYALVGMCVGLASLSHLYGLFWLAVLAVLAVWDRARWRDFVALGGGFLLVWLPYLAYVLADIPAWRGQTQDYAPRFRLLDLRWYLANVWHEAGRYGPGLPNGWRQIMRPGFWGTAVLLPISFLFLARQAFRQTENQSRVLLVPAVLLPLLFALLIQLKLANYLITTMPFFALVITWGAMQFWRWLKQKENGRLLHLLCLIFMTAVLFEGITRMAALETAAAHTTPYSSFIAQVREHVPPHSLVLGLHHYWLGMETFDYRSWFVPLAHSRATTNPYLTLPGSLTAVAPTIILLDPITQEMMDNDPELKKTVAGWMAAQDFVLQGVVEDESYGRMEIWVQP